MSDNYSYSELPSMLSARERRQFTSKQLSEPKIFVEQL